MSARGGEGRTSFSAKEGNEISKFKFNSFSSWFEFVPNQLARPPEYLIRDFTGVSTSKMPKVYVSCRCPTIVYLRQREYTVLVHIKIENLNRQV